MHCSYHESVKDSNVVVTAWQSVGSYEMGREIKFFKPVNLPGLASTRGVKLQNYKRFGEVGLLLSSSTRLEDVPAADCFSVDDTLEVRVHHRMLLNHLALLTMSRCKQQDQMPSP